MSTTYKINQSAVSSFDGTTLNSLSDFSISQESSTQDLNSDGATFVQNTFVDDVKYTVTVNGYDNSIKLDDGDVGILILQAIERDNGKTNSADDTITYTFAVATVTTTSNDVNHAGNGTVSYTFSCVSSDGTTDPLAVS